jgi:hypothetical protein
MQLILDDGGVDARRRAPYPTIHLKHVGKKVSVCVRTPCTLALCF